MCRDCSSSPVPVSPPSLWRSSPPQHRIWSPLVTEESRRIWSPAVTCEQENKINKNNNNTTSGVLVEVSVMAQSVIISIILNVNTEDVGRQAFRK